MNRRALIAAILALALAGCTPKPATETRNGKEDTTAQAPPAAVDDAPALAGSAPEMRLVLPARFERALAADGGGFTALGAADLQPEIVRGRGGWSYPWSDRQAPWAVVGDFNGDGRGDVALLQKSADAIRAVAVLDTSPGPTLHELHRATNAALGTAGGEPTSFYLALHPAGPRSVQDFGGERGGRASMVTLPHEGVTVVAFGQAATTHYFKDGRVQRLTTAD